MNSISVRDTDDIILDEKIQWYENSFLHISCIPQTNIVFIFIIINIFVLILETLEEVTICLVEWDGNWDLPLQTILHIYDMCSMEYLSPVRDLGRCSDRLQENFFCLSFDETKEKINLLSAQMCTFSFPWT